MEKIQEKIEELTLKEIDVNKKIDELDSKSMYKESIALLPLLYEIKDEIQKLNKQIKFMKEPDYTDLVIDLYKDEENIDEDYYTICMHDTKENIGNITYRKNNSIKRLGDIGYTIEKRYRGNNYALRSLNLIKERLVELNIDKIIITTNKDNYASIKTIEKFGGKLIEESDILKYECTVLKKEYNR